MKLILLLSIVAAASAFNSWDLPAPPTPNAPDMEQVRQQLAQQLLDSRGEASLHLEAFHGLMGRLQHAQLQDQTACNNALAAVSSLSTCVSTFSGLYSLSTAACPAAVTTYCDKTNTNSCASKFKSVLDNVVATCSAAELDAVTGVNTGGAMVDFNKLRSLFTLPCVTDNASPPNQCFCKFFAINSVNTASSSDSLTAALDTLCVPCTQIFFSALTAFSKSDIGTLALAAALQLLCLKDSGKYCFVYITKDYPAFALTGPSSSQLFEFLCANRCFEKYLAFNVVKADYNAGNTMTSATDSIRALCARDPSGNLCVLTATNYIASQTGVGTCPSLGSIIPTSACPSTCATFIKNFVNDNGCCASSWLAIQDIGQTNNVKSQNVKDWAKASCGASSIPAPCLSTATVKARIKIRNFLYSYYIAHQAAIDNAIRSDLGTFLQLPPSDVTIDASTNAASVAGVTINAAADNGVYYDVTIGAGSVNAVKGIGAQLSDSITTGTIGFAAVSNTVPPSGRADPSQSISADTTASVSVKSGAASSTVSPLVLLCSVFAVVLVLFKQ